MPAPLISIITTCYNSAATLPDTIQSVMAQSIADWEWVIVDDASSDASRGIIRDLAEQDRRVKPVFMAYRGYPVSSREAGLLEAKGRYAAMIDADDLWLPEKLERQLAFMQNHNAAFSYTAYRRINADGTRTGTLIHVPRELTYNGYLKNTAIACSSVMIDRHKTGKFAVPQVWHQDYAIWLSILKKGHVAYGLDEDLMRYRVRKDSMSANKFKNIGRVWTIYRRIEKLTIMAAAVCLAGYGLHATLKRVRF